MSEQQSGQQRPTFDEPYKPEDYPRPIRGEGILIPGRTHTQYRVSARLTREQADAMDRGEPVDIVPDELNAAPIFTCVDCGFTTREVDEITEHQAHSRRYHRLKQQALRPPSTMRGVLVRLGLYLLVYLAITVPLVLGLAALGLNFFARTAINAVVAMLMVLTVRPSTWQPGLLAALYLRRRWRKLEAERRAAQWEATETMNNREGEARNEGDWR